MSTAAFVVYAYRDAAGRFLYIGQTGHVEDRRASHEATAAWMPVAASFEILGTYASRQAALSAEANLLRIENPPHNVFHTNRERSSCSKCGRSLVLRRDGMLPLHREREGAPCDGGHRAIAVTEAVV